MTKERRLGRGLEALLGQLPARNDSAQPQKIAVLQISSSLDWRSIRVDGKSVQYVSQPYTSDIDHTAALSEAIVTLPTEVKPKVRADFTVGESVKVVQARLGHASAIETLDTYGHLWPESGDATREAVDLVLANPAGRSRDGVAAEG